MNGSFNFDPNTGEPIARPQDPAYPQGQGAEPRPQAPAYPQGQGAEPRPQALAYSQGQGAQPQPQSPAFPQGQGAEPQPQAPAYPQGQWAQPQPQAPAYPQGQSAESRPQSPAFPQGQWAQPQPGVPFAPYPAPPAPTPQYAQGMPQTPPPFVQTPPPPRPKRPKRTFTGRETAMAWLSALIGYFFCRTFWAWEKPLTALAFTFCLFAFGFVFFGKQKRRGRSYFYPVTALIISTSLFFTRAPAILFFVFSYVCAAFVLFCQTGSDASLETRAGKLYVFEAVKAFFVSPFRSIGAAVGAISASNGGKRLGKTLLMILAGFGVALVPTLIVAGLLSYDDNFNEILETIWDAVLDGIFPRFWSLVFGVPIGMYVYAALYASAHPDGDGYNAENCAKVEDKMKFAPSLAGVVAIAPLLFLYGVFIVAQRDYYKAVFTSSLPDAFTFAEFARDGFFRLCVAAAINVLALIALRVFTKKTKKGKISPVVKVCTVILSLVTVVISLTAISQMLMYVSSYGLTRMRVLALWFMALLILVFVLTVLKQIVEKLPFAAICTATVVICFGLIAIPDADAFIAEHNYACFVEGKTDEIDVYYLKELGPSAIPTLCKVAQNEDVGVSGQSTALYALGAFAEEQKESDFQSLNLPLIRARNAYDALDDATKDDAQREYWAGTRSDWYSGDYRGYYEDDFEDPNSWDDPNGWD